MSDTLDGHGVAKVVGRREQLYQFLSALYREDDLVEIRPIETWTDFKDGRKRSRMLRRFRIWLRPTQICLMHDELTAINRAENANMFVGVNPRPIRGAGKKDDIHLCRSVWADLDNVTIDQAARRWQALGLPAPSITVGSGRGVHAYWLLTDEFRVHTRADRVAFEAMLQALYRELGSDSTSDLSRLLRLPGFLNMKDARVGRTPIPCTLIDCYGGRTHGLDVFSRWTRHGAPMSPNGLTEASGATRVSGQSGVDNNTQSADVQIALQRLDVAVQDRSRRDYRVVCALLRLGLLPNDIWYLVAHRSKFETNGRAYFDTTVHNAIRDVFG